MYLIQKVSTFRQFLRNDELGDCFNEILEVGTFVLTAPVPFMEMNLRVPIEPMAWPLNRALRVSINSFGIGGSNAHVGDMDSLRQNSAFPVALSLYSIDKVIGNPGFVRGVYSRLERLG